MNFKKIIVAVLLVIALSGFIYILYVGKTLQTHNNSQDEEFPLPKSPLDASYNIEGVEITLHGGQAKEELKSNSATNDFVLVEVKKDLLYGDLDGDGDDDATLLLSYTKNDVSNGYYVAVAINNGDGFLGTNAVRLYEGFTPEDVTVKDELIVVTHTVPIDTEDAPQTHEVLYEYLSLLGATLTGAGPLQADDVVDRGMFVYSDEEKTFTSCVDGKMYQLSPNSRARAALEAVYFERTRYNEEGNNEGVYIVLAGHVSDEVSEEQDSLSSEELQEKEEVLEQESNTQYFEVRSILSAPQKGRCVFENRVEEVPEEVTEE